jgi:hypothetical protein
MSANAFIGRITPPTDADLATALGAAKRPWDQLLVRLAAELEVRDLEWKSHAPKWGWALRVLRRKRTIVWLSPWTGRFEVLFLLGEKAVRAARETKLPAAVRRALDHAPKYPEGTGLRLTVTSERGLPAIRKLAAIKLAH